MFFNGHVPTAAYAVVDTFIDFLTWTKTTMHNGIKTTIARTKVKSY